MLLSIKINNCFAFNNEINFSMEADMRIKKFISNTFKINANTNVLKTAVIYGPNNTGKTNFIKTLAVIQETLLNSGYSTLESNFFTDDNICKIEVCFIDNKKNYEYIFWYDSNKEQYIYEKFSNITIDKYNNKTSEIIFLRDTINQKYDSSDKELKLVLHMLSNDNILIYTIDVTKFEKLNQIKKILVNFGNKLVILDMNFIKNFNTVNKMMKKDEISKKIVNLVKEADLYLDDYYYQEEELNDETNIFQNISKKMVSVYKNKEVQSLQYDSVGTRKFSSLASYIVECLDNEKILVIDEIDSSLHFKLTRAILSLFNNPINKSSQLICTSHDISLLDCKKLFRKEQIWFTDKDEESTKLYSLKEFTAIDGIRDNTDLVDKYSKGFFAAIPEPDLIEAFYDDEQ